MQLLENTCFSYNIVQPNVPQSFFIILENGERILTNKRIMGDQITKESISQVQSDQLSFHESRSFSTKMQIDEFKNIMGLNVSEIASILNISRQTIYDWMRADIKLQLEHQEKLDALSEICLYWSKKKLGRLGSFLYKKTGKDKCSLFACLQRNILEEKNIYSILDDIGQLMINQRKKEEEHATLLKQHGFKDLSKEEIEKNFNRFVRKIS